MTRIGAATTHHEIETSAPMRARYPEMSAMISQVANLRVRSVGTLGGNLCFADPHSDPASFLMAVGATLVCQRAKVTRRISAAEFLTGLYETALTSGELLVAIELPARPERTGISHLRMKLTERPVVTVTALVTLAPGTALAAGTTIAQARLIVGSVASVPFAADTGSLLGAGPEDFGARAEACAEAAAAACTPLPDGEASPDYLRHLVRVHARQALGEAFTAAAA
jgi:aerobic carbon-monoxide dehydrogenase medium subunit